MARYRKGPQVKPRAMPQQESSHVMVLGMLYIAEVRTVSRASNEIKKHRVLLVGCEAADIEMKLRWVFDITQCDEFTITKVEKIREKVHILSTVVNQTAHEVKSVIDRDGRQQEIADPPLEISRAPVKLYAVGVTTTVSATDESHAMRKVGTSLVNAASGLSHNGPALSEDSTVQIEEISRPSGYARPRDVSGEVNRAHMVRG